MTLLGRLAGYGRELLMARLIGAGATADALVLALKIPAFFRRIFSEGALHTSLVPAYNKARNQKSLQAWFYHRFYALWAPLSSSLWPVSMYYQHGCAVIPALFRVNLCFVFLVYLDRLYFRPFFFLVYPHFWAA